ncbi:DUF960 domain-containing protein [Terrisporobacter muris]|uniref:DUF960 domain-containing protein n=1 Tax=Terrisporobacter muris TaxID=2963284 RepID=A0A9X2ME42_9FIRM|nr:DUF960 domain-containing protein [Terrisporobacter muris]MCR1825078.1 DUF960 domain-containing protein [Terrisporobacter muris]
MFDNGNRYISRGINDEIPIDVQIFMWQLIEELKDTIGDADCLQVFTISTVDESENTIRIIHSQEVPEYKKIWIFEASEPCNEEKIFVIDDGSHSTMLLAEEY